MNGPDGGGPEEDVRSTPTDCARRIRSPRGSASVTKMPTFVDSKSPESRLRTLFPGVPLVRVTLACVEPAGKSRATTEADATAGLLSPRVM